MFISILSILAAKFNKLMKFLESCKVFEDFDKKLGKVQAIVFKQELSKPAIVHCVQVPTHHRASDVCCDGAKTSPPADRDGPNHLPPRGTTVAHCVKNLRFIQKFKL